MHGHTNIKFNIIMINIYRRQNFVDQNRHVIQAWTQLSRNVITKFQFV